MEQKNSQNVAVVNDACESCFGVMTCTINSFRNIGLTHVGEMAMAKNGDFASGFKKVNKDGK